MHFGFMVGDDSELETAICGRETEGGAGSVSVVRAIGRTRYSCTGLRRRERALIGERTRARTQEEVRDEGGRNYAGFAHHGRE